MRTWYKNLYLWGFIIGAIIVTGIRPFLRHEPSPPPVLGTLPTYTLTNQEGLPFGSQDLQGKVYIANFIFTRCPSVCPTLTQAMAKLQKRFAQHQLNSIKLVSFSVDPTTDTPAVLKKYGEKFKADPARWSFLTGTEKDMRALIEQGFKLHLGQKEPRDGNLYDIAHAAQFALIDQNGNLRGLYNTDADGLDEVFHRSQHVLKQK